MKRAKRPLSEVKRLRRENSNLITQINARDGIIIALMQMLNQCHWDEVDAATAEIVKHKVLELEI